MRSATTVCGSDKTSEHSASGFEMGNVDFFRPTAGMMATCGGSQNDGGKDKTYNKAMPRLQTAIQL